jgi:UDP-N-acetylmuramate dehydrogenase
MEVIEQYSLLPHNSFAIRALTKFFGHARNVEDICEGLDFASDQPILVLGGGSNILLLNDFNGLTLWVDIKGIEKLGEDHEYYYVKAGAGENWHGFVQYCISQNFAGIENLSLIPGSVGASPMQNIGAYGVEIKDVFYELEAIHRHTREVVKFSKLDCAFDYRSSIFKTGLKDQYIILNVTFRFLKQPVLNTSYGAIEERLQEMGVDSPDIKDISEAVIHIRQSKLPDPKLLGNAGSFFKNPVISQEELAVLKEKYPEVPTYPQANGTVKIAAGWLIEKAGWKGKRQADAGVHINQALVLVNYGHATGSQIFNLSNDILSDVNNKFGIMLEREVNLI